jgi:hypothetical protein
MQKVRTRGNLCATRRAAAFGSESGPLAGMQPARQEAVGIGLGLGIEGHCIRCELPLQGAVESGVESLFARNHRQEEAALLSWGPPRGPVMVLQAGLEYDRCHRFEDDLGALVIRRVGNAR